MIPQANGVQKKAGTAIRVSDKRNFRSKKVKRQRWTFYTEKGTIHQVEITFVNIYVPNSHKGRTRQQHITVGDLTLRPHQWIDHPGRKSVRKLQP